MIINYLSDSLFMSKDDIVRFSLTAPHRYKVYEIPKRKSGQKRVIAHPSKELKFIQRSLIDILKLCLPVHDAAFAYRKGIGIKENAKQHLNSKYLLKMDFENFFPSITPALFFKTLEEHGFVLDGDDKLVLSGLLFWKKKDFDGLTLSIGAPTSPLVSNSVMYLFDKKISEICLSRKISYTRYADDITFSTNIKNILFDIPELVSSVLNELVDGVKLNCKKTIFTSKAHNRHVTGVTLTNDGKLSIGRERKRLISSMIHQSKFCNLTMDEASKLLGLISHAEHIEPGFLKRMIHKYGEEVLNNIKSRASGV
ncbi:retron St85 family RNA-directed DNA polymerase [Alishewanella longhuensis]